MRWFACVCCMLGGAVLAAEGHAPYAGLDARPIASLSPEDIAALEAGEGWGLALPAELNGYPGPRHVLDLADDLELTAAQQRVVSAIFEAMQSDAVAAGLDLIAAERALDEAFRGGSVTPEMLERRVRDAARARGALRLVHLTRHLETIDILSADQIARYNALRGYAHTPCTAVPQGHDPEMWRRHNRCP